MQILTGFLLTLPFTARFEALDDVQRYSYLGVLSGSVLATGLIIAPVAFHRMLFRRGQRPWLVEAANKAARAGLAALALTTSGMVWLVFDLVVDRPVAAIAGGLSLLFFGLLWAVVPLRAAPRSERPTGYGAGAARCAGRAGCGEQPRDLHLGDADVASDLLLGPALEEPQLEDAPVARRQRPHQGPEHDPRLGAGEAGLVGGHQVTEGGCAVLPHGYVERGRCERAVRGERLDDPLDVDAEVGRHLARLR